MSDAHWKTAANLYRLLVAAQTIALAAVSLWHVSRRPRVPATSFDPLVVVLLLIAGAATLLGLVAPGRYGAARAVIVVAWVFIQAAGALAVVRYARSGMLWWFLAVLAILVMMHVLSPNRFRELR